MLDPLYRRFPAVLMARRNLTRTKVRSALASLGIVIGVIAIASLGMFGVALQYSISENLGGLGNQVTVSPNAEAGVQNLTERDVREIRRVVGPAVSVSPEKRTVRPVSFDRGSNQTTVVYGIQDPASVYNASEGRIPDPFQSGVLVGESVAENEDLQPGNTISVNGTSMRVRAVLESTGSFSQLNPQNRIYLPVNSFDRRGYQQVYVTAESGTAANESAMAIRDALNDREQRVVVQELGSLVDQVNQTFQVINTVLVGIAAISLFVAGISILNVMLMSTVERREEIGVLRAVGYQKRDVLKVMLMEATLLGVFGGLVGVGVSALVGLAINYYTVDDATALFRLANLWYLLAAFAFAVVVSILSGLYPAWKAASEEPVEALRG
ncbi:ABC transporter permease [Haloarcula onubensis]|uniref:ABC transporter permease n=1 Tax=Haloarcula onubensis TaxID=2950539 RepID=A0ABU2FMT0_9EURY|nr:ABC transporter permease [Halomicroarcula sp. S3CR25-11]MDS0281496.1 ABC transporter permease [Halomicroarcula sp. S3CR25-11]